MQRTPHNQTLFTTGQIRLLQAVFLLVQGTSLLICLILRLMVYGFAKPSADDLMVLVNSAALSALLVLVPAIMLALYTRLCRSNRGWSNLQVTAFCRVLVAAIICAGCLSACQSKSASVQVNLGNKQYRAGSLQTGSTGIATSYKQLKPEFVSVTMNGEEIGHTDIPLGQSFTIRNEAVDGMVVRDGKVSVGCSLLITDSKGRIVVNESDVFRDGDVFEAVAQCVLKCTVNTGSPMAYDEEYKVQTRFWDKYGEGFILNEMPIRIVDIP